MREVRVGVILGGSVQERWVEEAVERVLALDDVRIAAVVFVEPTDRPTSIGRLHAGLETAFEPARQLRHARYALAGVRALKAVPGERIRAEVSADGWSLGQADIDRLNALDVDVWLCFTPIAPRRRFPRVSRLGLWGLEIGHGVPATSHWAGVAEIAAGSVTTMVSAIDYAAEGPGVLYRSFGATRSDSVRANRLAALSKGLAFFARLLDGRARSGGRPSPAALDVPSDYPPARRPSAPVLARALARTVAHRWGRRVPSLRWARQWQVAYYFADPADPGYRAEKLRYLVPPRDRFWADPFAVERHGRYFVFVEELPYNVQRGRLVAIEVFEDREASAPQLVLERPYHLSYPFLFERDGELFMMPETAGNRSIEVYRCGRFPADWSLHATLRTDVSAFDATLWREDGDRWWMFVNIAEPGADPCDELHLFHSRSPFGPWMPHAANPVVSDVRCARPAGPLFLRDGVLHRPCQDDSVAYGHAVRIQRIECLTEDSFRESTVDVVHPGWDPAVLRVHTVGRAGRLRVLDCMVRRPKSSVA
jgi:hypothetical protein